MLIQKFYRTQFVEKVVGSPDLFGVEKNFNLDIKEQKSPMRMCVGGQEGI